jgi:hypothetical protein
MRLQATLSTDKKAALFRGGVLVAQLFELARETVILISIVEVVNERYFPYVKLDCCEVIGETRLVAVITIGDSTDNHDGLLSEAHHRERNEEPYDERELSHSSSFRIAMNS